MRINKVRSGLYKAGRVLGDINAVKRHKIVKRLGRRVAGRVTGRFLGELFR